MKRSHVVVDDALVARARRTGLRTTHDVIERALADLVAHEDG